MQKKRIGRIGSAALALVMVLSFGLATPAPVAADVSGVSVVLGQNYVSCPSAYTINMTTTMALIIGGNSIVITFPDDTIVTDADIADNEVTVDGTNASAAQVTVAGRVATIVVPATVPAGTFDVVFLLAANVINPSTAGSYTLQVHTDLEQTDVTSDAYAITDPPGPVDIYDANGVYADSKNTIMLAHDDAACVPNGTLKAHNGTYNEAVVITKGGLTVESLNGAEVTIINASALTPDRPAAVAIKADDVTLGGASKGFTIKAPNDADPSSNPQYYGVEVFLGCDRSHIEGNIIQGTASQNTPQVGIHFWGNGGDKHVDTTVKNNTITTTFPNLTVADWAYSSAGIWADDLDGSNILIEGNTISGFTTGIQLAGLNATDANNPAVFYNNTVDGTGGLSVCTLQGSDLYVEVYENTFRNGGGYGLVIAGDYAKVYKNDIYGNGDGIGTFAYTDSKVADIEIKYNNIYGNTNTTLPAGAAGLGMSYTQTAVVNGVNAQLDVKHNYWDDPAATTPVGPTGPLDLTGTPPGNPGGRCAKITVPATRFAVDYSPWLYEPWGAVTPTSKPAYAQSVVLSNNGTYGWNTFSTPIVLTGSYNSWDELYNVSQLDYMVAYRWDTATQAWVGLPTTSTYAVNPGEGFFVKMNSAGSLPICYSVSMLPPPTRALPAGLAVLAHAGLTNLAVNLAVASLGTSCTQVLSPSCNTAPWAWVNGQASTGDMVVGEGYWGNLTGPATYAGFSTTPQPWVAVP